MYSIKFYIVLFFLSSACINYVQCQQNQVIGFIEYQSEAQQSSNGVAILPAYSVIKVWFGKEACVFTSRARDAKEYPQFQNKRYRSVEDSLKDGELIKKYNKELLAFEKNLTYRSIHNDTAISNRKGGGQSYCMYNPFQKTDWQLLPDTMRIDRFLCRKAKGAFYGKTYEVWYAPQIPVPFGPLLMGGLPGLILSAEDIEGKLSYKLKELQIPAKQSVAIECCSGFERISYSEYNRMQQENITNMMEMLKLKKTPPNQ